MPAGMLMAKMVIHFLAMIQPTKTSKEIHKSRNMSSRLTDLADALGSAILN